MRASPGFRLTALLSTLWLTACTAGDEAASAGRGHAGAEADAVDAAGAGAPGVGHPNGPYANDGGGAAESGMTDGGATDGRVTDGGAVDGDATPLDATVSAAPGAWARVPTGAAEAVKQTWYNLAYDTRRHRFYGISWMKVLSAFDPATGRWTDLTTATVADFHNRTIAYDPLNDRLWVSDGTGSGGAFQYFDFATNSWVQVPTSAPSYESVMLYDAAGKRFVAFGGWVADGVRTFDLQQAGGTWTSAGVSGGPSFNSDAQKFTAWRSALDSTRNRILYVDTDGSLWALPLDLSGWQHITPSGTPPPVYTQYVYDVANDALVGWNPSMSEVTGDGFPSTQQTFLLSLAAPEWQLAANKAAGNVVPITSSYVAFALAYDPANQQALVHVSADEFSPQTWVFKFPTAGGEK